MTQLNDGGTTSSTKQQTMWSHFITNHHRTPANDLESKRKQLKRKQIKAKLERKYRANRKSALKEILAKDPELASSLKIRQQPGKPRIELDQPKLLSTIVQIAIAGGAADERRRSEKIRTCKTLDELHDELDIQGFKLSRSATYLRLLPHDARNSEGKRHVKTVPVRLCKPENSQHKIHEDGKFCTATIRSVETLASILGNTQVAIVSQDDKARVPIGITAVNKQAPFLMSVEYKITLPDHDWVVAARHKLIPSVYAGIMIANDKIDGNPASVSYSGPTFVAIRSGKHSTSNASTHAHDFDILLDTPEFDVILKNNGDVKPVIILSVDGGPDENPRYPKVINHAIQHFQRYIFTNAPGRSAYNRVERRMAPLSRELSGVVLPFRSHLDAHGRTIDEDLEIENFKFAGLAEIWSELTIDNYPVIAEYFGTGSEKSVEAPSLEWYASHVRESQYFLQVSEH
ncbi:uncharacterized protein LOC129729295 [Wyeomyia smithii]|uniref:uncharacterized protein LOC129729295 n=1 Tax=Wyeomyia smithii TaxID=174621 RepID=UPI002467D75C|nr:uncharacterized protein LOC129729295 [Wyeomyia smithii]